VTDLGPKEMRPPSAKRDGGWAGAAGGVAGVLRFTVNGDWSESDVRQSAA